MIPSLGPIRALGLALLVLLPTGCGLFDDEERLEGERVRIRDNEATRAGAGLAAEPTLALGGQATPLPPPESIDSWTHVNAVATHNGGHLAGPASPVRSWRVDVGEGTSDDGAITSAPVVAGGRIYTLDAASTVTAVGTSGSVAWQTELVPEGEEGSEGFGGGLAWFDGALYATTGFGEVLRLDTGSGAIEWRTRLGAPVRAAPAADQGVVVAVTRDNAAFGLDVDTGEIRWRARGATSGAGVLGGASPAIAGTGAVVPFGSGEIVALDLIGGRRFWSAVLSGGRRGLARAAISDVTGDPVVIGQVVIAANQAGRIVAVRAENGRRIWTRSLGAQGPIWAAGTSLFLVSDTAELVRLDAATGATVWSRQLPAFEDEEDREDPIGYSGPVLVEGRLWITSSLGELRGFEATAGEPVAAIELGGGSLTGPVVAGNAMYVLTDDAVLEAYR
ncbi:MAG: PQQ-binding-like beta-propeller repeat protein [Pseudomonadota bacterium]